MRRKIVLLLATVGTAVGLVWSSPGHALMIDGQQCQRQRMLQPTSLNGRYDGQKAYGRQLDGKKVDGKPSDGGLSNDAEQHNGTLCQNAYNKPKADVDNKNINKNPQFTLWGSNSQYNKQKNDTDIDQSQHANAVQANVLSQDISAGGGPPGPHSADGGGGAPLSNDADQSNRELNQDPYNHPKADVDNTNINFNPQFTLVGDNSQYNKQSNDTDIDQSQHANAAQVNVAGQSIEQRPAPPVDPRNDADQSNGTLDQHPTNKPKADVDNKNVNFNPQFTLVGSNHETNKQSNETEIDQSQHANAGQANLAGQSIQQG
jgi:hypothetical protein